MLEQPYFGRRLKALRFERGLSQAALADGELSTGYLSRLESGARPPTKRVVEHLAKRLGVSSAVFAAEPKSAQANVLAILTTPVPSAEHIDSLADTLAADDDLDPVLRWQVLWVLARSRGAEGRLDEQRDLLTELVALSDDLGSPDLRVRTRAELSSCARNLGDYTEAWQHATAALELADDVSVADRAAALHAAVSAGAESDRLAEARAHAEELCALTDGITGSTMAAEAHWAGATVRIRQGDYDGARHLLERALDQVDSHTDLMLWMRLRLAAASLYLQLSPPLLDEAHARLDQIMAALDLVGTDLHHQQLLALRAQLAFAEGRVDDARTLCDMLDEQPALLSFRDQVRVRSLRGHLQILTGSVDAGMAALQRLAKEAEEAKNLELAAEVWRTLARALAHDRDSQGGQAPGTPFATPQPI